jgi:type II secretion system protein C
VERNPFDSIPGPLRSSPPVNDAVARLAVSPTLSAPPTATAPPLALLQSVRVVPEQMNGKVVGLRLFGIRPASLLGTLGLKNGDRLESINGFDVTNPEKLLEAYARLRTAPHLQLRLLRSGHPLEVDLNII